MQPGPHFCNRRAPHLPFRRRRASPEAVVEGRESRQKGATGQDRKGLERADGPLFGNPQPPNHDAFLANRDVANWWLTGKKASPTGSGRLLLFLGQFPDLAEQGVPKFRSEALPPGDLDVKGNVIILLESLERNVVKGIRRLHEIGMLTEGKGDSGIALKNRQPVM